MSLTYERLYPWLLGISVGFLAWLLDWPLPPTSNFSALLSAAISVSAILVGFLATMKSILMAVPVVLERVRKAEYLDILASYLADATTANLSFCAYNLFGFFQYAADHAAYFAPFWFGLATLSALSFWRVTRIMTLLLRMDPTK